MYFAISAKTTAYLGVGDAVHDDDGVDVGLSGGPFLQEDAGVERWLVAIEPARTYVCTRRVRER